MADSQLKHEIRATVLKWKLGVKARNDRQEKIVDNVFKELEHLSEVLFNKYSGSSGVNAECHRICDLWPMARRVLEWLRKGIITLLRSTPSLASPHFCKLSREIPMESFDLIWKEVIEHNNFGHEWTETRAVVTITITDRRKAKFIFNKINCYGVVVKKEELLRRKFSDQSVAEVTTKEQPMVLRYRKNNEVLTLTFNYGYWNSVGIPQH